MAVDTASSLPGRGHAPIRDVDHLQGSRIGKSERVFRSSGVRLHGAGGKIGNYLHLVWRLVLLAIVAASGGAVVTLFFISGGHW